MKHIISVLIFSFCWMHSASAQIIVNTPLLTQADSTTFELTFRTDSAAIITVHAAQDSTYRGALIFLGRTVGAENSAAIKLTGMRNNAAYLYRIFLGTEPKYSSSFHTGNQFKK